MTVNLAEKYHNLKLIHNPEFLTAVTAFEDFHNQKHIVLGKTKNVDEWEFLELKHFYAFLYPDAEISLCVGYDKFKESDSFEDCR